MVVVVMMMVVMVVELAMLVMKRRWGGGGGCGGGGGGGCGGGGGTGGGVCGAGGRAETIFSANVGASTCGRRRAPGCCLPNRGTSCVDDAKVSEGEDTRLARTRTRGGGTRGHLNRLGLTS